MELGTVDDCIRITCEHLRIKNGKHCCLDPANKGNRFLGIQFGCRRFDIEIGRKEAGLFT